MKKHIPNMITLCRIILVIISFFVLLNKQYTLGIILLLIAALTDFFDGYFARKLNASSLLGAKLDQLSDKLFSFLICIGLIILGNKYLLITLIIEIIFSIIVTIQSYKMKEWQESTKQGKIKISLLFITIVLGAIILKLKQLNVLFIVIWAITIIVQIYADTKIIMEFQKKIVKQKKRK